MQAGRWELARRGFPSWCGALPGAGFPHLRQQRRGAAVLHVFLEINLNRFKDGFILRSTSRGTQTEIKIYVQVIWGGGEAVQGITSRMGNEAGKGKLVTVSLPAWETELPS